MFSLVPLPGYRGEYTVWDSTTKDSMTTDFDQIHTIEVNGGDTVLVYYLEESEYLPRDSLKGAPYTLPSSLPYVLIPIIDTEAIQTATVSAKPASGHDYVQPFERQQDTVFPGPRNEERSIVQGDEWSPFGRDGDFVCRSDGRSPFRKNEQRISFGRIHLILKVAMPRPSGHLRAITMERPPLVIAIVKISTAIKF